MMYSRAVRNKVIVCVGCVMPARGKMTTQKKYAGWVLEGVTFVCRVYTLRKSALTKSTRIELSTLYL